MKAVILSGSPNPNGSTSAVTAEISRALNAHNFETRSYHLHDMDIAYCRGCKSCERTGSCVQPDDTQKIIEDILASQLVIVASPAYWGDITGQMKVFIDRCTPYSNTNPARPAIASSAKGAAIAVRAGSNRDENMNLVHTIEHFLGHLGIPLVSYFTVESISSKQDLLQRPDVLTDAYDFGKHLCGYLR